MENFLNDLTSIINHHGLDKDLNVPDRILAEYLLKQLYSLESVLIYPYVDENHLIEE